MNEKAIISVCGMVNRRIAGVGIGEIDRFRMSAS